MTQTVAELLEDFQIDDAEIENFLKLPAGTIHKYKNSNSPAPKAIISKLTSLKKRLEASEKTNDKSQDVNEKAPEVQPNLFNPKEDDKKSDIPVIEKAPVVSSSTPEEPVDDSHIRRPAGAEFF